MQLAAAHGDSWVTTGDRVAERPLLADAGVKVVREQMARLDEACVQAGRDPASLGRLVLTGPCLDGGLSSPEAFRHTIGVYAAAGVTDLVVHWPRPEDPYAGELAVFERIIASLG